MSASDYGTNFDYAVPAGPAVALTWTRIIEGDRFLFLADGARNRYEIVHPDLGQYFLYYSPDGKNQRFIETCYTLEYAQHRANQDNTLYLDAAAVVADTAPLQPWSDAAEAYATQSTRTCDHGHLLWQSCRRCGVGEYIPPAGPRT